MLIHFVEEEFTILAGASTIAGIAAAGVKD
jgi:hypothetical protein